MKKYLFTMATAAMLFASCSSDDTVVDNGANEEGLVEIKLGAGSRVGASVTESRAAEAVETLEDLQVNLFMLDNAGGWDTEENGSDRPVYWNNIPGAFTATGDMSDNNEKIYKITPNYAESGDKFYPRKVSRAYNFYAYYIGETTSQPEPTKNATSISVEGEFDGTQDIIWGMAKKVDGKWNEAYAQNHTDEIPNIALKHLLSWFDVKIVKGDSYNSETCGVTSLSIKHANKYTLTVANTNYTDSETLPEDLLTFSDEEAYITDLYVYEENGAFELDENDTEGVIGDIFVEAGKTAYTLDIALTDGSVNTVELTLPKNGIEAGKKYCVAIKISGPTDIKVTATLTEWVESTDEVTGNI